MDNRFRSEAVLEQTIFTAGLREASGGVKEEGSGRRDVSRFCKESF